MKEESADGRQGEIPSVIEEIEKVISQVDEELNCLFERLSPILKTGDTKKDPEPCKSENPYSSGLANILFDQKLRLDRIVGFISEINGSVEL